MSLRGGEPMTSGSSRGLVLVVDDSPDMRALISDVLTEEGYEVVVAPSGGRALTLMAERPPDLVITDLFMPGMSGFTLRGEMLRRPDLARVPVVVLSAFWQRPSETLDVVDVLGKPLDLDRLLDVVARAVAPPAHEPDDTGPDAGPAPSAATPAAGLARRSRRGGTRAAAERTSTTNAAPRGA